MLSMIFLQVNSGNVTTNLLAMLRTAIRSSSLSDSEFIIIAEVFDVLSSRIDGASLEDFINVCHTHLATRLLFIMYRNSWTCLMTYYLLTILMNLTR